MSGLFYALTPGRRAQGVRAGKLSCKNIGKPIDAYYRNTDNKSIATELSTRRAANLENEMDRFHHTAEARAERLEQLIDARTEAVENDILAARATTILAVAEKCESLNCDADEAEALVRAAVLGKSALVGTRIAEAVRFAIYAHVLPLAEQDLADIERRRAESEQNARIEQRVYDRFFSRGA